MHLTLNQAPAPFETLDYVVPIFKIFISNSEILPACGQQRNVGILK